MKSDLPKVLVPVLGRPMIEYALAALGAAGVARVAVVVGYRADLVRQTLAGRPEIAFIDQREQRGTGHAVMVCRELLADQTGPVLIVAGDSPLMQSRSLATLLRDFDTRRAACLLGTGYKPNPAGLGRIVRDAAGQFQSIVEEKDATAAQRQITEVNLSCYVFAGPDLLFALDRLDNRNAQGEYYLTDCPGILLEAGRPVRALAVLQPCESLSINTMEELAVVEREMQKLALPP
jgi:bifunctional UDP-N-acetylglucosamine pyrophosphorylase/glucosamine-1-phosphate N-acetyltransferase/UDP-N-acetylglucosamine pyrophosphorylase